jgi:regulator of protease activity HflC (stomatin/prohibitin superfamily)
MAYAVRSKGRALLVRDCPDQLNRSPEDPLYEVGPKEYVGFENLPIGTGESGDTDLDVEKIDLENGKWPEWVTRPESVQVKRAKAEAEAQAEAERLNAEALAAKEARFADAEKPRRKAKLSDNAKTEKRPGDE